MIKFSDLMIRNLEARDKPYVIREDAPRGEGGFAMRVMPSGAKTWQLIYIFEDQRKWFSLGQYPQVSLADARLLFRANKKLLSKGIDPGEQTRLQRLENPQAMTVDELCNEFLEKYAQVKKRASSAYEDELNLKRDVRPLLGKYKAKEIRRPDILEVIDGIMTRKAPVQANRTLATVRKMFAWALERGIVESNPASGISKPSHEQPKERALSMKEVATFWANAGQKDDLQSIEIVKVLKLILLTGCRPGEILALNWENVKGRWAELSGTSTKNKRPHRVFLSTLALDVMGKAGKGPVIKRYEGATIAVYTLSCWLRREKHLGLPSWTPHDLRRTCAPISPPTKRRRMWCSAS